MFGSDHVSNKSKAIIAYIGPGLSALSLNLTCANISPAVAQVVDFDPAGHGTPPPIRRIHQDSPQIPTSSTSSTPAPVTPSTAAATSASVAPYSAVTGTPAPSSGVTGTAGQDAPQSGTTGTDSNPAPIVVAPAKPKLPDNIPPKEMPAAMKLYSAGKYALAQKMFEQFINTGVADEATHMNLAYCLYYQRKYTQALKQFDWVNKNAKHSVTMQMKAQNTAAAIRSCMRGVCPGQCLKPDDPRWRESPNLGGGKWITWHLPNGVWKAYSEHHMGHVIQNVDGLPTDVGSCPICGGTGTVTPLKDGGSLPGG